MSRATTIMAVLAVLAFVLPGGALAEGGIIVDHTCTDLSLIPDEWIEQAKTLTLHYAHTSHGGQILQGLVWLETLDPKYQVAIRYGETPGLPDEMGVLRIFSGQPNNAPNPDGYWGTPAGVAATNRVAGTGDYDLSMFSWCGEQGWNETYTVDAYLEQMASFEREHPSMRFILMTGHTDGGGEVLLRNNELVREYARAHDMVLFDFAALEMYDPSGKYYANAADNCTWCDSWCKAHPGDCMELPDVCSHSGDELTDPVEVNRRLNCARKANAFWWMMARLAGWPGPEPAPAATPAVQ